MHEGIYSTHGIYTTEEDTVVLSAREGHGNLHHMGKNMKILHCTGRTWGSTQHGEQIRGLHYMGRTASFPVPGSPGASDFLKLLFRAELISTSPWSSPCQTRDSIFAHMATHRKCSSIGSAASQLPAPPLQEGSEWGGQEAPPQLENGFRGPDPPERGFTVGMAFLWPVTGKAVGEAMKTYRMTSGGLVAHIGCTGRWKWQKHKAE